MVLLWQTIPKQFVSISLPSLPSRWIKSSGDSQNKIYKGFSRIHWIHLNRFYPASTDVLFTLLHVFEAILHIGAHLPTWHYWHWLAPLQEPIRSCVRGHSSSVNKHFLLATFPFLMEKMVTTFDFLRNLDQNQHEIKKMIGDIRYIKYPRLLN